jgi:hypothetical protein
MTEGMGPQVSQYNDWTQRLLTAMKAQNLAVLNVETDELASRRFMNFRLQWEMGLGIETGQGEYDLLEDDNWHSLRLHQIRATWNPRNP